VNSGAPTKPSANQPLRIATLIRCIASTKARSPTLASPGMTAIEKA
jgi:hypothetical protein